MKKNQFLLLKLIEECVEVAHRASKQMQFGKEEKQKNQEETNATRLKGEILDPLVLIRLLEEEKEFSVITLDEYKTAYHEKKEKLQKYLNLSASLGQLPEIKL